MAAHNARGNYRFLPGIEPYSSGAAADEGFEIVHVALHGPLPYEAGFQLVWEHLTSAGRPVQALCGVELRSPAPFTREGFAAFNAGYCRLLESWDLLVEGQNPVPRTNVAPRWRPPAEPSLYAFSYTVPVSGDARPTFIVAGAGELRGGPLFEAAVIRPGETSPDALREKAAYVMSAMERRLSGLGVSWADVTTVDIYSAEALDDVLGPAVLDRIGEAATHGLRWYHARPPIDELAYEMDCRGVARELVSQGRQVPRPPESCP